jgi:hypothetical protein
MPVRRPFGGVRAVLLALVVIADGCGSGNHPVAAPLFDSTVCDLGPVRADADYVATYRLANRSGRPLHIQAIRPSCGCLVAGHDDAAIPPGGTRELTLNFSTRGLTTPGPLQKFATVQFDSGEKIDLQLKATLTSEFDVIPRRLVFSSAEPVQRVQVIRRLMDENDFRAVKFVATSERYDLQELITDDPGRERHFEVVLKASTAGASLPDLYLSREHNGKPLPFSQVKCSRLGPTLRPSAFVTVLNPSLQAPPPQTFQLFGDPGESLEIVEVKPVGEKAAALFRIGLNKAVEPKSFTVSLTQMPDQAIESFVIAVRYRSKDGSSGGRLELPCNVVRPFPSPAPGNQASVGQSASADVTP